MINYDTISTETWKIQLPKDWSQRECSAQHTVYFESADQTKGAYFSTWGFENDVRSAREIMESFRRVEVRSLHEMPDRVWQKVGEWSSESVLGEDFLSHETHYRIACHLVCRLPWLVRSAFHDYDCQDYESSKRFFQPIIESLQIHDADT